MDLLWRSVALVLITTVLVITLEKQEKDIAVLLSMVVCIILVITAGSLLDPIISFLQRLEKIGSFQSGILKLFLKIAGIGVIYEITGAILSDSRNGSLAKGLQLITVVIILNASIPVLETFLDLLQQILGAL